MNGWGLGALLDFIFKPDDDEYSLTYYIIKTIILFTIILLAFIFTNR